MRKLFVLLFAVLLIASCGASKTERHAQKTLKGDWTLNRIELPSALVDVSLFEDADTRCFEYSEWNFISNNNKGSYQILKDNCNQGTRKFRWNIQENQNGEYYFTLKHEVDGINIRHQKRGFRLKLVSLDENNMILEETTHHEGRPFVIRMSFSKN